MKRYVRSSYGAGYSYYYQVEVVDDEGDLIRTIPQTFDEQLDAMDFAVRYSKDHQVYTQVVFMPEIDPDNDPDAAEWYREFAPFDPYEVVFHNYPD